MIGSVIDGTYRVVDRLGAGAMGEVHLVEHVQLGRREALKVLLPELAGDATLAARFRREARAINRLRHPNIVGIYDFGQLPDGRMYLVMEYAAGEELDRILDRAPGRRLPLPRALLLAQQLASAIDHAHGQGVVHRDLKPSNLMVVSERGRPEVLKILDFGVAKVLDPEGHGDELTRRGEVFGTPEYLAPERLAGGPDDPRSDLYAIGCIIHELVAGAPPFSGSLAYVLASHMQTAPPRLAERVPGVPPALDGLVHWMLAKSPADRPQSGGEIARALAALLGDPGRAVAAAAAIADDDRTVMAMPAPATPTARDLREQLCEVMVQVAEAALAHAPGEAALVTAVGYIRGVRDERARLTAARTEVDAHHSQTVQAAREREGSLRFAIADLRFERTRAATAATANDVDFQIEALALRVQEVSSSVQRVLRDLEDHGVHLAVYERELEPRWVAAHRHLRVVLGARLAGISGALDQLL